MPAFAIGRPGAAESGSLPEATVANAGRCPEAGSRRGVLRHQSGFDVGGGGYHFARRSNRFWRAIHLAGFTPHEIAPEDGRTLLDYGCGLTTAVARASRQASEISVAELAAARRELEVKIEHFAPRAIAFLGKPAFAAMHPRRPVAWGLQPARFGGSVAWVLPNPGGLNLGFTLEALVERYGELHRWVMEGG